MKFNSFETQLEIFLVKKNFHLYIGSYQMIIDPGEAKELKVILPVFY